MSPKINVYVIVYVMIILSQRENTLLILNDDIVSKSMCKDSFE